MAQYSVHALAHSIHFTLASTYLKCWLLWWMQCAGHTLLYVMAHYSVHVLAHIIDFTLVSTYLKCWLLWCICSGQHAGHDTTCHLAQPHLGSAKYWYLNITLALNMPYMDAFWAVFHLQNRHSENGRKQTLVAFQMHSVK